jgi:hypothetical protein
MNNNLISKKVDNYFNKLLKSKNGYKYTNKNSYVKHNFLMLVLIGLSFVIIILYFYINKNITIENEKNYMNVINENDKKYVKNIKKNELINIMQELNNK